MSKKKGYEILIGKKISLSLTGCYAVIYTFDGEDVLFPIVGEVVCMTSDNHKATYPAKWNMKGRIYLSIPGDPSRLSYNIPLGDALSDATNILYGNAA